MRVVDITWTIGPVFRHEGSALHWLDFAVVLGMGGLWLVPVLPQSGRPRARAGAGTRTSRKRWLMADTNHASRARRCPSKATASATAASSGSSSILTVTTVVCQLLVWGCSSCIGRPPRPTRAARGRGRPRRAAAGPVTLGRRGRTCSSTSRRTCRRSATHETRRSTTYGWVDQNAGDGAHADRARQGTAARARAAGARRRRRRRPRRGSEEVDGQAAGA